LAITAEKPEWNESECPIDFNSAETGKAGGSNHSLGLRGLDGSRTQTQNSNQNRSSSYAFYRRVESDAEFIAFAAA